MQHKLDAYCPCCGYNTFDPEERLNYIICPICSWEDDPVAIKDINYKGGANRVSLTQARENYKAFGACEVSMIPNTSKATGKDILNPLWKME